MGDYLELLAIAAGGGVALLTILAYMLFADESKALSKRAAHMLHHFQVGIIVMLLGWAVYEWYNIYLGEFLWGYGFIALLDDGTSHIRDYVEKRRKDGRLWE